jgi:hypothetical protein
MSMHHIAPVLYNTFTTRPCFVSATACKWIVSYTQQHSLFSQLHQESHYADMAQRDLETTFYNRLADNLHYHC